MKLKNLTFLFITFLLIQLTTLNTYSVEPEEILENKQHETTTNNHKLQSTLISTATGGWESESRRKH